MAFSVLLLTAANSERHISGYGGDRVSMQATLEPGEIVFFFDRILSPKSGHRGADRFSNLYFSAIQRRE